jgi:fructokinase
MSQGCGQTISVSQLLNQVALVMDNPNPIENPGSPARVSAAGEALTDLIGQGDGIYEPCIGRAVFHLTRARALPRQVVGVLYLNPLSRDRFGRSLATALVDDCV